jgi:hypothetical protein
MGVCRMTSFEICIEIETLYESILRTKMLLESLTAPNKKKLHFPRNAVLRFEANDYQSNSLECVRILARNLERLVETYNQKGLRSS